MLISKVKIALPEKSRIKVVTLFDHDDRAIGMVS